MSEYKKLQLSRDTKYAKICFIVWIFKEQKREISNEVGKGIWDESRNELRKIFD